MHKKLILTGASGKLGSLLRASLRELCKELILSDLVPPAEPCTGNERFVACDLADHAAVGELIRGADMVLHFGGVAHEQPFETLLPANIVGSFNLYDNALKHGVPRIVLASSNHATGFYRVDEVVHPGDSVRPDSLYGTTKAYAETLGRFYHDRHGIETIALRIGSCFPVPKSLRCLVSWLSPDDLRQLVRCAVLAQSPGFAVVYGVSDNQQVCWKEDDAARIGYQPKDSAEDYRAELLERFADQIGDPRLLLQGGSIVSRDYRDDTTLAPHPPVPWGKTG